MNKINLIKKCILIICVIFSFNASSVCAESTVSLFNIVPTVKNNEISVLVKYVSDNMCGGSFNFVYDNTKLKLISVEAEKNIKDTTHFINQSYTANTIRVNWVSTTVLPTEGTLLAITFDLISEEFDKNSISIDKLKVADENGEKIAAKYEIIYNIVEDPEFLPDNQTGNGHSSHRKPSSVTNSDAKIDGNDDEVDVSSFSFGDVSETDWYYEAVKFAFEKGITSGVSETEYAPHSKVTRGQFITMLCRAYGIMEMIGENFADCGNTWYTGYLAAAKQLAISNGVGDNKFAPEKEITREEMVTLIYNYLKSAGKVDEEISETTFADNDSISYWAKNGVAFASSKGYVNGKGDNLFDPNGDATRAELAQIFFNMFK